MRPQPDESGDWDALLVDFRALGGTADNVALRRGKRGRGLFPIDPVQPVRLRLPPGLIVPVDQTELRDKRLIVKEGAPVGARERAFFDRYQREFVWGAGVFDEIWREQLAWSRIPTPIQDALRETIPSHEMKYTEPTEALCLQRYFSTRQIRYGGNACIMPIVELVNHGGTVATYDLTDGITIAGTFDEEILANYSADDCWGRAIGHGICEPHRLAQSLACIIPFEGHTVRVARAFNQVRQFNGMPLPMVHVDGSSVGFSYLTLGNTQYPRLPRSVFLHIAKETPIKQADELFGIIQHLNRMKLINFLRAADGDGSPLVATLRRAACQQLATLSQHWGAVPIVPSAPNPRPAGAMQT